MNNIGNNNKDRLVKDDDLIGGSEGIWMDYEKGTVILTITNPETGKLMNIDPKIFVTSYEERAFIRIMEGAGYYYMGLTDEDGNIPEDMFDMFKCSKENTILHPKYPPYKNCNMIFIQIPGMGEKEDSFDDIREDVVKELFGIQEEIKTRVRVLCNSGITYGNLITRKPIKQYKMLKNYY